MVNFIFTSTGLRDAKIAGKTLFLGVSMTVFPSEIRICIGRLNTEDCFSQSGWILSDLLSAYIEQKARQWVNSSSVLRQGCSWLLGLCIQTETCIIGSLIPRPWGLESTIPPAFLGLQLPESDGTSQPP